MCLDHMRRAPERTCRWRRTLPYPEPSRPSAAFFPCRSSADCTIITSGCDLRHVHVEHVDLSVQVLGHKLAMPVYCSPTALQRLFHHEGERAVAHAAQKFGTIFGVSSLGTVSL